MLNEIVTAEQAMPSNAPLPAFVKRLSSIGMPTTLPEQLEVAFRMANGLVQADMVPVSLQLTKKNAAGARIKGGDVDEQATATRVAMCIMRGFAVGFDPLTSVQTIMVINNKPCIYGDGGKALLLSSGLLEDEKVEVTGSWATRDLLVTVSLKRRGVDRPYVRSFGYLDAERAGLTKKDGPWMTYPERQCMWRAWTWSARDGFADVLYGLSFVEEQNDITTEARRNEPKVADTSDLDDVPKIEQKVSAEVVPAEQAAMATPADGGGATSAPPQNSPPDLKWHECEKCGGTGWLVDKETAKDIPCDNCDGQGFIYDKAD